MPFFEGKSSPSWSQYYLMFTQVLFLNQLIVNLFLFPKDQKTSPSLFFSFKGFSNYFFPESSSYDQDFSIFLFLSMFIYLCNSLILELSNFSLRLIIPILIYLCQLLFESACLDIIQQFKMLEWLFGKKKEEPKPEVHQQKKKKKMTQVQQETEDRWQYEFLVQFLNSPLWRVSILDFVDQNCVVFDSQQQNKFQYTKIHNQFKELVGSLFDGMMRQIGLDDDKLVQLLEKGFQSKQKKLFNQLLLCDDFLKFKELMVKRNKALEVEAIKAMNGQQRRASTLDKERSMVHSSIKGEQDRKKQLAQQQQEELRKVLQMSRLEAEQKKQIQKLAEKANEVEQQKLMNEAIEKERKQRQARQEAAKEEQIKAQNEKSKRQIQQIQKQTQEKLKSKITKTKNLEPLGNQNKLADLPPIKTVKKQPEVILEKKEQITKVEQKKEVQQIKEEVKEQAKGESTQQRKKRLLEQRQKIRKKKEEERKKMLEQEQTNNKKTMNIVLQDDNIHDSVHPTVNEADQKVSKDEIERRKEIMRKIKNRIVDDF